MTTAVAALPIAAGDVPELLPAVVGLVVAGALIGYFGHYVRLVPIVGFLLAGVLIGPNALGIVNDIDMVRAAADVGVLLLLFTIGLEFSLGRLREIRRTMFIAGGSQVLLATAATTIVLVLASVNTREAVFTGLLVALSSTAIVLKLLVDRGQLGTETGRLTVAILLFQDLAVVAMVLFVPVLGGEESGAGEIALALAKAVGVIAAVLILARRAIPPLLEHIGRTCAPEIFLLTVMAICFGTAYAVALAGVSVSLGAFLAGLLVSESRFQSHALTEVLPLQIVFSAVFFVSVGMLVDIGFVVDHLPAVVGVVAAMIVLKALTTGGAALALGRTLGIAAAVGLMLAQVGEFSFVLAAAGDDVGLTPAGLGDEGTQGFIAATVILMALTPGLSRVGERVADRLRPSLAVVAAGTQPQAGATVADALSDHVIVAGYGEWARGLTRTLRAAGVPAIVITLSPDGAAEAHAGGFAVLLGDAARRRTLTEAGIERARVLVIVDDEADRAELVVGVVRALDDDVELIARTRYAADEPRLLAAGASQVVSEELIASTTFAGLVLERFGIHGLDREARLDDLRRFHEHAPVIAPGLVRSSARTVVDTEHHVVVKLPPDACPHVAQVRPVVPRTSGCEECLRIGDSWVQLRLCLTCGHVGCCDSSPNRHARAHHEHTGHDIARSAEPGESWVWCFADERELAASTDNLATVTEP